MPQLTITKEQYIKLRQQGMSQQDIVKKYSRGNQNNFQALLDAGTAVTNAVGGSKVAETFGTEIARIGKTPEQKATIESMAPTVKQTTGSALQVGSLFTPFGTIAKGIKGALAARGIVKGASLAGNVGAGAAGGYAYDVGGALAEDKSLPLAPRLGTALGAAIPAVATGVVSTLKKMASKTPSGQMSKMTDELSSIKKAFDRNSRYAIVGGERKLVTDPISTLSKYKIVPEVSNYKVNSTPAKEQLQSIIDNLDNQNSLIIDSSRKEGVAVSIDDLEKMAMRVIQQDEDLKLSGRTLKSMQQAKAMFDDFRSSFPEGKLDMESIDGVRTAMNRVWNPDEVDGARAIGNAARQVLALSVPETRQLMQQQGEIIATMKFLDALHGKAVTGGKLGRYFSEVIGGMIGQSTNIPVVGTALGALGARAISHKIAQSYFQPIGSKTAQKILGNAPKFTSPGDMFAESQTGKAVTNYAKNVQPGLSMKNVAGELEKAGFVKAEKQGGHVAVSADGKRRSRIFVPPENSLQKDITASRTFKVDTPLNKGGSAGDRRTYRTLEEAIAGEKEWLQK